MYKCQLCNQLFYSTVDGESHLKEAHPEAGNPGLLHVHYRCPRCGRTFEHPTGCQSHAYVDHRIYKAECLEISV